MASCAPDRENLLLSCYKTAELVSIYRELYPGLSIPDKRTNLIAAIWRKFPKCKNEICWRKNPAVFRPKGTTDDRGWLTDENIDQCLGQYEKIPELSFRHLGSKTMDFWYFESCMKSPEWANNKCFSIVLLENGIYEKFLDHWVCFFVDLPKRTIEFFDPMKYEVPKSIQYILCRLSTSVSITFNTPVTIVKNNRQVQKLDGDCGVIVLDYIISRINGKSGEKFMNSYLNLTPGDYKAKMLELRTKLFN